MESLEQMKVRLASLNEQKVTAEKSSDIDYAKELAVEIKELENQVAVLRVSEESISNLNKELAELPKSTVEVINGGTEDVGDAALRNIHKMFDRE